MRARLAGCLLLASVAPGVAGEARLPKYDWHRITDDNDREHIRTWRDAWMRAIDKAGPAHAAEIAAAGNILQPDAALGDPLPPAGTYRCRVYKIGALTPANADFAVSPPALCRIDVDAGDPLLSFEKSDGNQRPVGKLYPDDDSRMIFLGTVTLADESASLRYGRDSERDAAGLLERIGAHHWRLVLPFPRWEALIEVIDLVPEG